MNFARRFALFVITPLFSLLLIATAFDMSVLRVASQPGTVKQILSDSGIYNTSLNGLLDQSKQISSSDNSDNISLSNPIIRSAAAQTFTPQFIQKNTETVIDSVYAWLNGKTATPDFSIDLNVAKDQFATAASQAVEKQAASLPACTAANIPTSFDALSAACLPPDVTPAAAASEVQGDILSGQGFLDSPVINANSVKINNSSQSVFSNQLKNAPTQFQRAKKSPIVLAALAFLAAIAIVFLSASRRKGLRHVGVTLAVIGLLMLIFSWGLNYSVTKKLEPNIKLNNAVMQTDVRKLVTDITQRVDRNYWIFGGVYLVLGALALGAAMLWKDKTGKAKAEDDFEGEGKTDDDRIDLREPDSVTPLAVAKTPAKKPAGKKTIKIQ